MAVESHIPGAARPAVKSHFPGLTTAVKSHFPAPRTVVESRFPAPITHQTDHYTSVGADTDGTQETPGVCAVS